MKLVKISEFKSRCIRILKTVARSREGVIITLRGRPLAKVEPVEAQPSGRTLGGLRGCIEIEEDLVSKMGHPTLAESCARARQLLAEESYEVEVPPRRNRRDDFPLPVDDVDR